MRFLAVHASTHDSPNAQVAEIRVDDLGQAVVEAHEIFKGDLADGDVVYLVNRADLHAFLARVDRQTGLTAT